MAINLWRYVEYTDDGCALYQCLRCYGKWEGRGEPGYIHHETGVYVPSWHFCPICGTYWDGKRTTDAEKLCDKALGPRRLRLYEAMERLRRGWFSEGWPEDRKVSFYWQLEVRQSSAFIGKTIEQQPWSIHNWIKGFSMPVPAVLAHARYLRKQMHDDVSDKERYDLDGELVKSEWTTQIRVTTSKTRPPHGYELSRPLNP